jgi:hypothetical protein
MARRNLAVLVLLVSAFAASVQAQEVGEVVEAKEALKILASGPEPLEAHEPVQAGLIVSLIPKDSSVLFKLTVAGFIPQPEASTKPCWKGSNSDCFYSEGPNSELTIEEARREAGTGKLLLGLKLGMNPDMNLNRGTLWMTLGQLILHQVWVQTPQLKAWPLGTSFRVLVDPVVGTFLATDEGSVRAELNGGEIFLVTAGHWLLVPPAGTIQRGPAGDVPPGLDDPPGLDCCDFRTGPPEP